MRFDAWDPYRWRRRFALIPRRVGELWVWLEWYEVRPRPLPPNPTAGQLIHGCGTERRLRARARCTEANHLGLCEKPAGHEGQHQDAAGGKWPNPRT